MIQNLIFDFSRVLIFPKDDVYTGGLNALHDKLSKEQSGYAFKEYFFLNEPLLSLLPRLKERYDLYIFTTGHIQNIPEIEDRLSCIFKAVTSVEDIPFSKKDTEGYRYLLSTLNCLPEETLYIDDSHENILVAKQAGLQTILFLNNQQLFADLKSFDVEAKP